MTEKRLSLGINVSILLILTIFGILLSLPLKLLLNTNYDVQSHENQSENDTGTLSNVNKNKEILELLIDYRKLKLCRRHGYKDRIRSIFYSDYDENCTYMKVLTKKKEEINLDSFEQVNNNNNNNNNNELVLKVDKKIEKEVKKVEEKKVKVEKNEEKESQESKEIVVAGHILVTMLLVSAIAALVEVLRIRFSTDKNKDTSSSRGNIPSRKSSTVDLPIQRRFLPREPMKSQKSFELLGMHKSSLRLLGERPAPLIRRSSFPTQQANNKRSGPSATGTPNIRMSRRQSAESEEEIGVLITALHHRTRLIRRH